MFVKLMLMTMRRRGEERGSWPVIGTVTAVAPQRVGSLSLTAAGLKTEQQQPTSRETWRPVRPLGGQSDHCQAPSYQTNLSLHQLPLLLIKTRHRLIPGSLRWGPTLVNLRGCDLHLLNYNLENFPSSVSPTLRKASLESREKFSWVIINLSHLSHTDHVY